MGQFISFVQIFLTLNQSLEDSEFFSILGKIDLRQYLVLILKGLYPLFGQRKSPMDHLVSEQHVHSSCYNNKFINLSVLIYLNSIPFYPIFVFSSPTLNLLLSLT